MNTNPSEHLRAAFGTLLTRYRTERKWTTEALAAATGLSDAHAVSEMECGEREPTLTEFFAIANALGEPPAILLVSLLDEWRANPTADTLYKSRASDYSRLFRLGFFRDARDFRELQRTYGSLDEATAAARSLNTVRHRRKLTPVTTLTIYVRLGHTHFAKEPGER